MATSSPAFDAALEVDARGSRALAAAVAAVHGVVAAGLWALPAAWALGGTVLLLAALVHDLRRVVRPARLTWQRDGTWSAPGRAAPLRLGAATFVSRWLVVLVLVDARGRTRRVVLARDAVAPATWRRLVARLRVDGPRRAVAASGWRAPPGARG